MTANEKFDKVTDLIEKKVETTRKGASRIAEDVSKEMCISERDLSIVFSFISGKTLIDYVKERKMMDSYKSIINSKKFDASYAIEKSGLGDQPTFNKRFKKMFGYTPKEAHKKKDYNLLKEQLSWDNLAGIEFSSNTVKRISEESNKEMIFGMEKSKFNEIKGIIELQDMFGFDELQSELAYYMHKKYDVQLKDAFAFVSEYHYDEADCEDVEKEKLEKLSREEYFNILVKEDIDDPEIRYVYFKGDMNSIYTTLNVIERLHDAGMEDATKVDIDVINICAYEEIDVEYCERAIRYFKEHATDKYGKDAFEEYIESILSNVPIEIAFENILWLDGWDDFTDMTICDLEEVYDFETENEYDNIDY